MNRFQGSLDANAILRVLVNDVPKHYLAVKKLIEEATGQLAVSDTALIEVAFVLHRAYGFDRTEVRDALLGFMSLKQINCNRILFDKALDFYASTQSLSLEDCVISTYAELNDALPLYTFDKKLANSSANITLIR